MFVFRTPSYRGSGVRHSTSEEFIASHPEINRRAKNQFMPGFNVVEGTGRFDMARLYIRSNTARRANGTKGSSYSNYIANTAAGVKTSIRRVRPEEESILAQDDLNIVQLERRLEEARRLRAEHVAEAWTKAHVVRLQEVQGHIK